MNPNTNQYLWHSHPQYRASPLCIRSNRPPPFPRVSLSLPHHLPTGLFRTSRATRAHPSPPVSPLPPSAGERASSLLASLRLRALRPCRPPSTSERTAPQHLPSLATACRPSTHPSASEPWAADQGVDWVWLWHGGRGVGHGSAGRSSGGVDHASPMLGPSVSHLSSSPWVAAGAP